MQINSFYSTIITDHNLHPAHKHALPDANAILQGVNPSCGDNITLLLKISPDGHVTDGAFLGEGCAISQASADMMLDLMIGRTREEARELAGSFMRMIQSDATPSEIDALEEASSLKNISHMPSRVKCAVLPWRTLTEILEKNSPVSTSA